MSSTHKPQYVERAHHWMVKASDSLAEARVLISSGQTRLGAYSRLYYAAHHISTALLGLVGKSARSHRAVINQFSMEWVKGRALPAKYGTLLKDLYKERALADYGSYVPTLERDLSRRLALVERFRKRASREIPAISIGRILKILTDENPDVRDFSFDVYCPKSYYH